MSKSRTLAIDKRITLYGSTHEIDTAEELIGRFYGNIITMSESDARIALQSLLDTEHIKATILFAGNTVYSYDQIIKDIRKVKKNGMESMTNRLYKFFSLSCGSIAHYNKFGWIAEYPTIDALRNFFKRNEFGQRVLNHVPNRFSDVVRIVKGIEEILGID